MKKTVVILVIVSVFLFVSSGLSIYGFLRNSITLSNVGSVKTIGVGAYWDSACTNKVSAIDWGMLEPGSTRDVIIYLKNEGNAPITLSLSATNWSPSNASNYISIGWSYSGEQISPGNVIQVTLSLLVSSGISGITNFTFDIAMTETG